MKRRAWSVGRFCIGIAASAGLGWLSTRGLDWSLVLSALNDVSLTMVTLAVFVFIGASYLRAARWRVLFVNGTVSTNRLFVIQNIGIGLNNVVPIRIASEAVQLAILSLKDGVRPSVALATIGMERVLDVIASTAILVIAVMLVPEMQEFMLYVWGAVGLTILCVALVRLLAWGSTGVASIRRLRFLAAFATAVRELEAQRTRLALSTVMTAAYWLLVGMTAWILADSIDLSITPATATLVIMGTIFFATAIPAAPAAIGTFEFAVVYVLDVFGVSRDSGFVFAVLTHAVFFLPPTIMAAVFLPSEGIVSIGKLRAVIGDRTAGNGPESA